MYISGICNLCNFKFNDTILLSNNSPPSSYEIQIKTLKDLNSRVIKSTSCTIEIKELGIIVEPGPSSLSYITNIEGLLTKIKSIVMYITNLEKEDKQKYKKGLEIYSILEENLENPETSSKKITVLL